MELTERVEELKQNLPNPPGNTAALALAAAIATNGPVHLSADDREKLLAELGFDWNSTGEYLVVSKDSLRKVALDAVRDGRLSDVAAAVLAVTPEERASLDSAIDHTTRDYQTWAATHVQRTEPQGNVMAKYTLPADAEFSQNLSNAFTSGVMETLGAERGGMMLSYANSWMVELGMDSFGMERGPTTLTLTRSRTGKDIGVEVRSPGSMMTSVLAPHQPFPEPFRAVFPGGWPELAKREGFELPVEFQK
jgi:CubicO group peptidase (beta-lactamase class C family)